MHSIVSKPPKVHVSYGGFDTTLRVTQPPVAVIILQEYQFLYDHSPSSEPAEESSSR
jgi:hypothetical protein